MHFKSLIIIGMYYLYSKEILILFVLNITVEYNNEKTGVGEKN